jgi:hypothetical protein
MTIPISKLNEYSGGFKGGFGCKNKCYLERNSLQRLKSLNLQVLMVIAI